MPVNDHMPVLARCTGLHLLSGSVTTITSAHLLTTDGDNTPQQLEYHILEAPLNGYLAFNNQRSRRVNNFTQSHINRGRLVFVHHGMSEIVM